jgi:hypothetical protein
VKKGRFVRPMSGWRGQSFDAAHREKPYETSSSVIRNVVESAEVFCWHRLSERVKPVTTAGDRKQVTRREKPSPVAMVLDDEALLAGARG